MVNTKDALLSLTKAIDGTMTAAKLALAEKKTPETFDEPITYSGEFGEVEFVLESNILSINCKAEGQEKKNVAQTLFDLENPDWNDKDVKSVANVICEAVSKYFGTECVYPGKAAKAKDPTISPEIADFLEKGKQAKKKKENVATYEAEDLAHRFEVIYPVAKGKMDENIAKYEKFLPEDYFETNITPLIIEDIKLKNKQTLKKVFNAFNTFYEEGGNDVQSLIVVSILGVNLANNKELFENCKSYMDANLLEAVEPVMSYLCTGKGKKKLGID